MLLACLDTNTALLDQCAILDYDDHKGLDDLFESVLTMVIPITEAKRRFSDLLKRAAYGGETVTIGSRGKPEAALISVAELERLRAMEMEHDARLLEETVRTSAGTVGLRDLLRDLGKPRTPERPHATPAPERRDRTAAARSSRARG